MPLRARSGPLPKQSLDVASAAVAGVTDNVALRPDAVDRLGNRWFASIAALLGWKARERSALRDRASHFVGLLARLQDC